MCCYHNYEIIFSVRHFLWDVTTLISLGTSYEIPTHNLVFLVRYYYIKKFSWKKKHILNILYIWRLTEESIALIRGFFQPKIFIF